MKSFVLISISCLSAYFAQAQTEKIVKTGAQRITVFQQGALMTTSENISVSAGTTNIIFENVSPVLQANSLQASAKGDLIVMDVQYRLHHIEQTKQDIKPDDPKVVAWRAQVQAAQDSLDELAFVRREIQQRTQTLQQERNVLTSNRMMRGEFQRDSLQLLMQGVDFLRKRLFDIDAELLKLEKETYKENRLRNQLTQRINTLNALIAGLGAPVNTNPTKPIPQIIVTVMAERALSSELSISYFVQAAGWAPSYDLKASKESQSVELKHRATVYQNTGVDWKDVYLTLSTGNPSQNNIKPSLSPQWVGYARPVAQLEAKKRSQGVAVASASVKNLPQNSTYNDADDAKEDTEATLQEVVVSTGVQDYTKVNENLLRVEYEIKLKYSIESDNKTHNVVIQSKTMPAVYTYAVVPKLDMDAFLMARITGWEDMNLVPGTARLYFDNSYIGESEINPRTTGDTLQLNLGRDKSIVVTRIKLKDKSKVKNFSDNQVQTHVYEIVVRNTKMIPIRIVVEDQMPVTREADIKIEYTEDSGAKFNPETGKLLWDLSLKARDSKRLTFSYELKSPKGRPIIHQ